MKHLWHLLRLLRANGDLLIPEDQLRFDLRLEFKPAPTTAEINDVLNAAESRGLAISIRDSITGEVKWRITELGRVALSERNL